MPFTTEIHLYWKKGTLRELNFVNLGFCQFRENYFRKSYWETRAVHEIDSH